MQSTLYSSYITYREALHIDRIKEILLQFPKWRDERLPPPRVSQSEVSGIFLHSPDKYNLISS